MRGFFISWEISQGMQFRSQEDNLKNIKGDLFEFLMYLVYLKVKKSTQQYRKNTLDCAYP
jgi:hypothetical protein